MEELPQALKPLLEANAQSLLAAAAVVAISCLLLLLLPWAARPPRSLRILLKQLYGGDYIKALFDDMPRRLGQVFRASFHVIPTTNVVDPKAIRSLLSNEFKLLRQATPTVYSLFGEKVILFTYDQAFHKQLRKDMHPYFTTEKVMEMLPGISRIAGEYMDGFARQKEHRLTDVTKLYQLQLVSELLIEMDFDKIKVQQVLADWKLVSSAVVAIPVDLPFTTYGRGLQARRRLDRVVAGIMERIRAEQAQEGGRRRDSLFAHLIQLAASGERDYSDKVLIDNAIFVIFAGHETAGQTLNNAVQYLSVNPEAVAKARNEQDKIRQQYGDEMTPEVLAASGYLEAIVKETLRLQSPLPFLNRKLSQRSKVGAYDIPKGSIVSLYTAPWFRLMPTTQQGINSSYGWLVGQDFRPDRWIENDGLEHTPQGFMPFGHGPHLCLGMNLAIAEMKVFLAKLVRRFDFESVDKEVYRPTTLLSAFDGHPKGTPMLFTELKGNSK